MPKKPIFGRTYAKALESFVFACTDAVIIDRKKKLFYLAKRQHKPMNNWWIIGGRQFAGETPLEAMHRAFTRETSLNVSESRFKFVVMNEYRWKNRQQKPQNKGLHNLSHTFLIELSPKEREQASQHLERNEYDAMVGLRPFSRRDLVKRKVSKILIDLHDIIFK